MISMFIKNVIKKDQNIYKTWVLVHHYYYIIFFWNNENRTKKRCHGINKGNHECIAAHHDNYCYWNVLYVCGLYCFFFILLLFTPTVALVQKGVYYNVHFYRYFLQQLFQLKNDIIEWIEQNMTFWCKKKYDKLFVISWVRRCSWRCDMWIIKGHKKNIGENYQSVVI